MKKNSEQSLKEAILELLKNYQLAGKLDEVKLIGRWPVNVGKSVSAHTRNLYIHNRTLFVELDSSIVRHELMMIKSKLMEELNKEYDNPVIDNIIFK